MSDNLMLFNECTGWAMLSINESGEHKGKTVFRGKFQEANAVNKNKRMYPFDVLDGNVKRLQETIEAGGLTGELDHPSDSIIHFKDASHKITKLWWEGNVLMGEGVVLSTPAGKVLKALIDDGVRVGISSRGVGNGTVNNEGVLEVSDSFKLITFDCVADPSTFSAFQQKIVKSKTENYQPAPTPTYQETKKGLNSNAFVSYIGCLVEHHKSEIRNKKK